MLLQSLVCSEISALCRSNISFRLNLGSAGTAPRAPKWNSRSTLESNTRVRGLNNKVGAKRIRWCSPVRVFCRRFVRHFGVKKRTLQHIESVNLSSQIPFTLCAAPSAIRPIEIEAVRVKNPWNSRVSIAWISRESAANGRRSVHENLAFLNSEK